MAKETRLNHGEYIRNIQLNRWEEVAKDTFDNKHFRYDIMRPFNCKWNLIYSGRNDGKSTAACADEALKRFFVEGKRILYLRRYGSECSATLVEAYFQERCLYKIINELMPEIMNDPNKEQFTTYKVRTYAGIMYISGWCPFRSKWIKLGILGYYTSLDKFESKKSGQYSNVQTVIYEEFLATTRPELTGEFEKLLNAISTYTRDNDFKAILIGNTVKRRSSIFDAFNIRVDDVPLGIVKTYEYDKDGVKNTVAVLHAKESKAKKESSGSFYFGEQNKTNLIGDEWLIADYPKIPSIYQYNNFKPDASFLLVCSQIKLYIYFVDDICLCSNERLCDEEYVIITDRVDINKKWISQKAGYRVLNALEIFRDYKWIYYNCNEAGDDLSIFLAGGYGL